MTIETLVVQEALKHIKQYGFVKNMDEMALHVLKTSDKPLVSHFRDWMRREALRTQQSAQNAQKRMSDEFAHTDYWRKGSLRRAAVIHPYYASKAVQNGDSWNDKRFVGRVRRDNPKIFPQREGR